MSFFMLIIHLIFLSLWGCAASPSHPAAVTASTPAGLPAVASPAISRNADVFVAGRRTQDDSTRLATLWQKRTQHRLTADYPIGPGDVVEISVPEVTELENRVARVSGEGTLSLPLVGEIRAGGRTEQEVKTEIQQRLEKDYVYDPQISFFVREYHSRQVAVVGAVDKPGLYNLTSGVDTLLDMITRAGGMTGDAAPRIQFIPAEPVAGGTDQKRIATESLQLAKADTSALLLKQVDPIVIELNNLTQGGGQTSLALPARPGDVIMIPGSGEVLLEGWVAQPGSYKITSGLTVLGAVAAAGGPMFPADTSAIKVIRLGDQGTKLLYSADLEKIRRGEKPDIPVQEGDIINVASSTPKLIPYGMYRLFSSMFRAGVSASLP